MEQQLIVIIRKLRWDKDQTRPQKPLLGKKVGNLFKCERQVDLKIGKCREIEILLLFWTQKIWIEVGREVFQAQLENLPENSRIQQAHWLKTSQMDLRRMQRQNGNQILHLRESTASNKPIDPIAKPWFRKTLRLQNRRWLEWLSEMRNLHALVEEPAQLTEEVKVEMILPI